MSGLALAGAISGMGQGLQQGLANMQQGFIQSGLLKERDEMENKRMQLTFEHQEKLQTEKIASDRAIHADALQNAKEINQTNVGMHIATTGMTNEANKGIHESTNAANKEIHDSTNKVTKSIAEMQDLRKEMEMKTNLDISKNSAFVKVIDTAEKEVREMRIEQAKYEKLAETALPDSKIFERIKSLQRDIDEQSKAIHLYRTALAEKVGAPKLEELAPVKIPRGAGLDRPADAASGASGTGGVVDSERSRAAAALDAMPPYRRSIVVPPALTDPRAIGAPPSSQSFGQRLTEGLVDSFGGDYRPPGVTIIPRR